MRENLSPNKAAAVFTPTIDTITAKLVKPGSGTWLQGFMFADPADAVTFKLMWSAELA
jgi:hypothetical protein